MRRCIGIILGLALVLAAIVSRAEDRDVRWEMMVHTPTSTEVFVVEEVDSLTFRAVPIPGVCCIDYDCILLVEEECDSIGGVFHPEWPTCNPNPCPPPPEAICCDGDYCIVMPEQYCEAIGGIWHPGWVSCEPNPCLMIPEMIRVPAGDFIMGDGIAHCGVDEHEVILTRDFYLGKYEVTNREYLEALQWAYDHGYVIATTSYVRDNLDQCTASLLQMDSENSEIQFDGAGAFYLREAPCSWAQEAYPGGYDPADHPVKMLTWYGAARFCDWMSLRDGLPRAYDTPGDGWPCNGGDPYGAEGYRLPTDAEWEYAAQFNDERIHPWGDEEPNCDRVNYAPEFPTIFCVGWTSAVGSYPPAPVSLGLYDMMGNVAECCNDLFVCDLGFVPVIDPVGPETSNLHVSRGSSWMGGSHHLRCAYRGSIMLENPDFTVSLRVARTVAR